MKAEQENKMKPEQEKLLLEEALNAIQEFVDRVNKGEVGSSYTYNKFKKILEKRRG